MSEVTDTVMGLHEEIDRLRGEIARLTRKLGVVTHDAEQWEKEAKHHHQFTAQYQRLIGILSEHNLVVEGDKLVDTTVMPVEVNDGL